MPINHAFVGGRLKARHKRFGLWGGRFSTVHSDGYIVTQWLARSAEEFDCRFLCLQGDGPPRLSERELVWLKATHPQTFIPVVAPLIGTELSGPCFQVPQDDGMARGGILRYFPNVPDFDSRKDVVFWRGACSGDGLRLRVTRRLLGRTDCDVMLVPGWRHDNPNFASAEDACFASPAPPSEALKYKYVLIIDGNGLASGASWLLATGSVPVLIARWAPFWLESAEPWVHYAPVNPDLNDLEVVLEHLANDQQLARGIAAAARRLAGEVLSSEGLYRITRANLIKAMERWDQYRPDSAVVASAGWLAELREPAEEEQEERQAALSAVQFARSAGAAARFRANSLRGTTGQYC